MQNIELDKTHAGIKIAGRSTSNLRYTDDTTLMAESEEELKSLLMNTGCFSILAILSNTAMDIAVHVSFQISDFRFVFLKIYTQEWDFWVI